MTPPSSFDPAASEPNDEEAQRGRVFGPYQVVGLLGRGGMGETYLACDRQGREVALKTIRSELATDPAYLARFRREALSALHLRSNFVARVWAFDADASPPWLALEKIDGELLRDWVDREGPLSGTVLSGFAADVAEAVHAFFDQGLAHGDLTPSNVMVQDGKRVKILDLGLTRPTADEAATEEHPALGTPYWQSPEVAAGFSPDSSSDVQQWAKLVLFAATGYPSATGMKVGDALASLPASLRPVVQECLEIDPARRPSPTELWNKTRTRIPPEPRSRAKRLRTRKRALLPSLLAGALCVAAVGAAIALREASGDESNAFRGFDIFKEGAATVQLGGHDARIMLPAGGPANADVHAGVASPCVFLGDFDVQVTYDLTHWAAANGGRVGLIAGTRRVGIDPSDVAIDRLSDPDGDFVAFATGADLDPATTTRRRVNNTRRGILRLVRQGSAYSGYTDVDGHTAVLAIGASVGPPRSAAPVRIAAQLWGQTSPSGRAVALGSFRINRGRCS